VKIHPAADIFPMMNEDELQDLAADIKENGLIHPIITDSDGELVIDGRNRLAACKLAGIKPVFEKLNGLDPLAYIVSANLARRNLTKGQQAMALAFVYPESAQGKKDKALPNFIGKFSSERLRQARTVLHYSRKLAEAVVAGTTPLNEAIETVRQQEQQSTSKKSKLERLRASAPDLADRVEDEKISVDEGLAILSQREQKEREIRDAGREAAEELPRFCTWVVSVEMAIKAGEKISLRSDVLNRIGESYKRLQQILKKD